MNRFLPLGGFDERYFDGRSIWLLTLLFLMACTVSPLNPLPRPERRGLLLVFPPITLAYWFLFQALHLSLMPGVYYASTNGFVWRTNSIICLAFGAAFSLAIILGRGWRHYLYGGFFMALYLFLIFSCLRFAPLVERY
jgi:hypothetical protein